MEILCIAFMGMGAGVGGSGDKSICHPYSFSILLLSSRKTVKEAPANVQQKTKVSEITFSAETGLSETLLGPG